jgi:large subunit ribosomal protein L15
LNPYKPITLKELQESGCVPTVRDGIKLLARVSYPPFNSISNNFQGKEHLKTPIHIFCSKASAEAIAAVEAAGGTITTRYYTKFSIEKILEGKMHPVHSRLFQPTPISQLIAPNHSFEYALPDPTRRKFLEYYRDRSRAGYLSYQVKQGHTPSLYFRTPGVDVARPEKAAVKEKVISTVDNKMW